MNIKDINKILNLLFLIYGINIVLSAFYLLQLDRPIFYYEYLLIPLFFCFFRNYYIRFLVFLSLLVADVLISFSKLYYFDTFNFLQKFSSIFISNFSIKFWVYTICILLLFFLLIHFLITKSILSKINHSTTDHKTGFYFLLFSFILVFSIDLSLGSSSLKFEPNGKFNINFSQSIIKQYVKDTKIYLQKFSPVSKIGLFNNYHNKPSISYQYLQNDSSNRQVLIILESWGLDADLKKRTEQLKPLMILNKSGYKVSLDSSFYFGGTSQAEVRELYNKSGEAYYSIIQNGKSDINGLVKQKHIKGYTTIALQSFSGYYSNGYHFRKIAGFDQIKDYNFFKTIASPTYNNHYIAVKDEVVFDYGLKQLTQENRAFLYILTINTHLPFHTNKNTSEFQSQFNRIQEQFTYLAELLKKYPVNTLVIVGDHPPPFLTTKERSNYSTKFVPALIIKRVKN